LLSLVLAARAALALTGALLVLLAGILPLLIVLLLLIAVLAGLLVLLARVLPLLIVGLLLVAVFAGLLVLLTGVLPLLVVLLLLVAVVAVTALVHRVLPGKSRQTRLTLRKVQPGAIADCSPLASPPERR
jgi:hypothetical protein